MLLALLSSLLLSLGVGYTVGPHLPWWYNLPLGVLVGFVVWPKAGQALLAGFVAGLLAWGLPTAFQVNAPANAFAQAIGFGSAWELAIVAALLGAVQLALALWAGTVFRGAFSTRKRRRKR